MKNEVLDFIQRRFQKDCDWTTGNCYWFAQILHKRFKLPIYYIMSEGHFIVYDEDNQIGYDWTGIRELDNTTVKLSWLEEVEPELYQRLIENCIL